MRVGLITGGEERHRLFSEAIPHVFRFIDPRRPFTLDPDEVRAHEPDVIFVYGAGKLDWEIREAAEYVLNFHGGDPELYRGLDSNLWAIYHKDLDAVQVTLHHVDNGLDTGDIVFQTTLRGFSGKTLQEQTLDTCIKLAKLALIGIETGFLPRRPQRTKGRYYSKMPHDLFAA